MIRKPTSILQANVNHWARAQDLLLYTITEDRFELTVVSEPYRVPEHPDWITNHTGSVSVVRGNHTNSATLRALAQGRGFVLAAWGELKIAGIYAPPSWSLIAFEKMLSNIHKKIAPATNNQKMLILGDFNAKSSAWGSPNTDPRGHAFAE